MDVEVKQRNRRRRRAQRMQAQRESCKAGHRDGDSADDDENVVIREKPQRPPIRRKKSKEPLVEEDIVEGFSILQFRSYEDLELVLKISSKENIKRLSDIVERPKLEPKTHITHHISAHNNHGLSLTQDPATSDDSGRASERLTGSSVAPRDADSSRDRLSDASSRCSSGKGYICDSEGEDDKGSDASSVIFASTPTSIRKREFPGALPPGLPLSNGTSNSPVPAPTPPHLPVPSPAPAQQPPLHPPASAVAAGLATAPRLPQAAAGSDGAAPALPPPPPPPVAAAPQQPPPPAASVPASGGAVLPQQPAAAAPMAAHHPPPALDSTTSHAMRTDSPAVATSANVPVAPGAGQYHHPASYHQPLYAPYAVHTPYSNPSSAGTPNITATVPTPVSTVVAAQTTTTTTREAVKETPPSPRGHSPSNSNNTRERESYSNVSSLSRGSATPLSCPPPTTVSSSLAMSKPWSSGPPASAVASAAALPPPQLSPAPPRPTPPPSLHTFQPPMFTAPLPPVSRASPLTAAPPNPNPFSAESLFQSSNHADMLRRELDNRFLASQDRSLGVAPPPYLRTEMHQHQHHHTHVHQHTTSLLPPPGASSLFPTPLAVSPMDRLARRSGSSFKDIPKLGGVESSPFYRQNIGMGNYPGYTPGLMHPGLTAGPTPFVPPNHLPTFQPKSMPPDPNKPKTMKTGKWNAMHVRVAWEIYHHQQKSGEAKGGPTKTDLLRPPSHLFSPSVHSTRPHEMSSFPPSLAAHRPPGFDQPHPSSLFTPPPSHLGKSPFAGGGMSPFTRYGAAGFAPGGAGSPFGVSPFASARDMSLGPLHDPWRGLQRNFPPGVNALPPSLPGLPPPAPWTIKPDPILEQREREAREREERERERARREREERERERRERELREEKQRRLEQQQQQERERERREKERREMERRELERAEREREQRERMLHHQHRLAESAAKQMAAAPMRDRSPLRNGQADPNDPQSGVRVKEEPGGRAKAEEEMMLRATAADPRYHPFLRHHPSLQPPPRMFAPHFAPPPSAAHWPPPPTDPFYHRYEPLRYNPLVDVMRAEEERAKLFGAYGHPGQLRPKDNPALMHLRPPPPQQHQQQQQHKMSATPPSDLHSKKEEPR